MGCGPSSRRRDADTFSSVVEEKTVERVETNKKNTLTRVNQYKVDKMLGKGAFGAVYSATDEKSEIVAIKVMDKAELRKKSKAIPGKPGLGGRPGGNGGRSDSKGGDGDGPGFRTFWRKMDKPTINPTSTKMQTHLPGSGKHSARSTQALHQ